MIKGYIARNKGSLKIEDMSFYKTKQQAERMKGQEICQVRIFIEVPKKK